MKLITFAIVIIVLFSYYNTYLLFSVVTLRSYSLSFVSYKYFQVVDIRICITSNYNTLILSIIIKRKILSWKCGKTYFMIL